MRWLIWYLWSLLCDHEWEYTEAVLTENFSDKVAWVSATCKDCGWHRSYRKF